MSYEARIGEATGRLVSFERDRVRLEGLSAPFAPGAPVSIEVEGMSLDGKSLGSKQQADGFALTALLRTLPKHKRQRLKKLFP
ncbi:MAG: hypothetical protein AAF645_21790 [Myxococcota bacterium]